MKKIISALFLSIFCFLPSAFADVVAGDKAPSFSLRDTHGKTVSLDSFKGKVVVLEWFNDGCPFVKKHYGSGNMQKLQKTYTAKDVVWLSISSSAEGKQGYHTAEEHNQISAKLNAAPTAMLLDSQGSVGKLYGAKTTPDLFIINKDGIVSYSGAIDDTPSTNPDDIVTAKNYVSAALDEILAGKPVTVASTESYGCGVKYAG
jgi:peroxiredoxin